MSRIAQTFAQQGNQKSLIAYITAGDPNLTTTLAMMHSMAANGADIIELGIPFSDPMADGPTIQRAVERALAQHVSLRDVLATVKQFRQSNERTPVVLMGYLNPIHKMGYQAFAQAAAEAGVDGGFVYYVSLKGVTGSAQLDTNEVAAKIAVLRQHIKLPIGVGFGISDAASAAKIAAVADAVIVGSRIVKEVETHQGNEAQAVGKLVRELKAAI